MIKKLVLLLTLVGSLCGAGMVAANNKGIDVNSADQSQLESITGIGPKHAKAILDERQKNGPFKDGEDLKKRVSGIGDKSLAKLQANGLTIGKATENAPANKKKKDKGSKNGGAVKTD